MARSRIRVFRLVALVAIAVGLSATTYAFTAGNTVPSSLGGDGSGSISGYTVTVIAYTLNPVPAARHLFGTVSIEVVPNAPGVQPPSTVKVSVRPSMPLVDCTNIVSNVWQCSIPAEPVLTATQLRVVAAQ